MSKRTKALSAAGVVGAVALAAGAVALAQAPQPAALKSASALAFAPNGVLLVGDSLGGQVVAIETGDTARAPAAKADIADVSTKIAAMLGVPAAQVSISDIAVNPANGNVYIAVSRGTGAEAVPVIVRTDKAGALAVVDVAKLKASTVAISDKPTAPNQAAQAITDLVFVNNQVLVAGLSNEEFNSSMRTIAYPFRGQASSAGIEMYHGAHGRFETASPVRTFMTYTMNNQPVILAAYTCTPIVKIPLADVKPGARIKATTIAELGNRNRPIDMISYEKGGQRHILLANSSRGVMKLDANNLERHTPISTPIADKAGIPYDTIADLKDVTQLDKLDASNAVIVVAAAGQPAQLKTIALP